MCILHIFLLKNKYLPGNVDKAYVDPSSPDNTEDKVGPRLGFLTAVWPSLLQTQGTSYSGHRQDICT